MLARSRGVVLPITPSVESKPRLAMQPAVSRFARPLVALGLFLSAVSAPAQNVSTGTLEGRVLHVTAGTYLAQARVFVAGTVLETFTDDIGAYRLAGIPAGSVSVSVSFAEMRTETSRVVVAPGQVTRHDVQLQRAGSDVVSSATRDGTVLLDAFSVSERALSAQASALQEQKTAPNIKNVVTFEEFGDLGEGNPGEFLKFVPGIEVGLNPVVPGNASIRGMPGSGTLMLVDGVQFASTAADGRGADLVGANIGNIDRIEVTKVPTPDQPANAVGGTINIIPKSNLSMTRRQLTYNVFATHTTIDPLRKLPSQVGRGRGTAYMDEDRSLTQPGFDLTYLHPVNKTLALSFSAGYSNRVEIRDFLNASWNLVTHAQTASQKNPIIVPRERRLLSATADYRPSERHRFTFRAQYTDDKSFAQLPTFAHSYGTLASSGPDFSQGSAAANGSVTQNVQHYNQIRGSTNGRIGYQFTGDVWRANVHLGLSRAQYNTRTLEDGIFRTLQAQLTGLIIRADNLSGMHDQVPPTIRATNAAGQPVDTSNINLYNLTTATGGTIPLKSNQQVFKADLGRDFHFGVPIAFKTGLAVDRSERDIRNQTWTWTINPPASAGGRLVGNHDLVDEGFSSRWKFGDGSKVQWLESRKAFQLFREHPEYFQLNEASAHTSGVNGSKLLEEIISAAYLRADAKFLDNRLWLVAGVRYERTDDEGRGPLNDPNAIYQKNPDGSLVRGANGRPVTLPGTALQLARLQYTERASYGKANYDGFYPSVNSSYTLLPDLLVRAAWARTIGRPDITAIVPGVTITDIAANNADPVINEVNTGLLPWHADNYDLSLESYNLKGATIAASLFRKDVTDFFTSTQRVATQADLDRYGLGPEYIGYDLVTTTNSAASARVEGVELSWRQSLRPFAFVPEWARGLQVYANTTRLSISGAGKDSFLPFRPKLFNYGASYTHRKALIRVNVAQQGAQRTALVTPNATTPVGTYQYIPIRIITDVSFEYRFSKHFALYGSARNLFQNPRKQFRSAPDTPAWARAIRYDYYGALLTFGIKGTY